MINRESILSRTHYGTNIYSHILRQFYPGESVMYIVGRDCGICRNPFNNGDATLHIWMEKIHPEQKLSEEISRHHDSSGTIPDGDCFDFAQLYWNKAGQDLLNTINEELYLHLEDGYKPYGQKSKAAETERPIRRILFSFFKAPITNTQPYKNITILDAYNYITGDITRQNEHQRYAVSMTPRGQGTIRQHTSTIVRFPVHSRSGMTKHLSSTAAFCVSILTTFRTWNLCLTSCLMTKTSTPSCSSAALQVTDSNG